MDMLQTAINDVGAPALILDGSGQESVKPVPHSSGESLLAVLRRKHDMNQHVG